ICRWWKELGLPEKLEFARDRLAESFQWALALAPEPQFSYCRKIMSKLTSLINVIDDIYDIYGSLDELHLFTSAIQRLIKYIIYLYTFSNLKKKDNFNKFY
ncbi:Trans-ocimene synthase, chloroplastic, partial [Linum perenne]